MKISILLLFGQTKTVNANTKTRKHQIFNANTQSVTTYKHIQHDEQFLLLNRFRFKHMKSIQWALPILVCPYQIVCLWFSLSFDSTDGGFFSLFPITIPYELMFLHIFDILRSYLLVLYRNISFGNCEAKIIGTAGGTG